MNIGLEFTKTEKFVNGPATIVKMQAKVDLSKIPAFSVVRKIPFIEEVLENYESEYHDGQLVLTGVGVSKCNEADKFDEKKGYYIAQSRASMKIMKKYRMFMSRVISMIDNLFYNDINDIYIRTWDACYSLEDHINFDLIEK